MTTEDQRNHLMKEGMEKERYLQKHKNCEVIEFNDMFNGAKTLKYIAGDKYNDMFKVIVTEEDIANMKNFAKGKGDVEGKKLQRNDMGINYYGESKAIGYLHRDILQLPGTIAFMNEQIDTEVHAFKCHKKEDDLYPGRHQFGCKICCMNQLGID